MTTRRIAVTVVGLVILLATGAASAQSLTEQCTAGGGVMVDDEHCCWPSQAWDDAAGRCGGEPSCPTGTTASGNDEVGRFCLSDGYIQACESNGRVMLDDTWCCWPGQTYEGGQCSGTPTCPAGLAVSGTICLDAAYVTTPSSEAAPPPETPVIAGPPQRPISLSVWEPFATWSGHEEVRGLSINLLYGHADRVRGLEIGGLVNAESSSFSGIQIAGLLNSVGGPCAGLQLAIFGNLCKGRARVIQVGAVNLVSDGEHDTKGLQLSLANNVEGSFTGIQVGLLFNLNGQTIPIDSGSTRSWTEFPFAKTTGIQASFLNRNQRFAGLQLGAFNVDEAARGISLGLVNWAGEMRGLQLGLINVTRRLHGLQIGVINVAIHNKVPFTVLVNAGF